jgi:uncharacterized SAM-binding protein YcdF (DUF218 family)
MTLRTLEPFLAVNAPIPGGVMVVEGWASDHAIDAAIAELQRNHYDKVFVTGGPIEHGAPLSEYNTQAEFGAAVLLKKGLSPAQVEAVPSPLVTKDRTFTEALTLKKWLREHGQSCSKFNLITEGPHARRSRLMFQKALGPGAEVGVIPVPPLSYDEKHWWRSSPGVRTVIGEALAYGYARFLFRAPKGP